MYRPGGLLHGSGTSGCDESHGYLSAGKRKEHGAVQKYLDQLHFEDIEPGREEEAFHYFLKSALRKNVYAYEALAKCYEQGIGVQKNEKKAQEWLRKKEECE